MSKNHKNRGKKGTYTGGGGMSKHRKSGVAHNHANSIARTREYNKEQEELKRQREKRKPPLFSSVKEVFNN